MALAKVMVGLNTPSNDLGDTIVMRDGVPNFSWRVKVNHQDLRGFGRLPNIHSYRTSCAYACAGKTDKIYYVDREYTKGVIVIQEGKPNKYVTKGDITGAYNTELTMDRQGKYMYNTPNCTQYPGHIGILRIDTTSDEVRRIQFPIDPDMRDGVSWYMHLWSAGFTASSTGDMFCPPNIGTKVLHYIPASRSHPDGRLSLIPTSWDPSTRGNTKHFHKWQHSFTEGADGCLYTVSKCGILRIDPSRVGHPDMCSTTHLRSSSSFSDAWSKLCLAKDNCLYSVESDGSRVVQLTTRAGESPILKILRTSQVYWDVRPRKAEFAGFTPGGPDRALYSIGSDMVLKLHWGVSGKAQLSIIEMTGVTDEHLDDSQLVEGKDGMLYALRNIYDVVQLEQVDPPTIQLVQVDPLNDSATVIPDVTKVLGSNEYGPLISCGGRLVSFSKDYTYNMASIEITRLTY